MNHHLAAALLSVVVLVPVARADIIVPEVDACRGHNVGDACDGGHCVSDGFSCQAGSCRRFDDEAACRADGCSWVETLRCEAAPQTAPAPSSSPTPSPATSPVPVPTGCSAAPSSVWVLGLIGLGGLLARGPRRHRRGPAAA